MMTNFGVNHHKRKSGTAAVSSFVSCLLEFGTLKISCLNMLVTINSKYKIRSNSGSSINHILVPSGNLIFEKQIVLIQKQQIIHIVAEIMIEGLLKQVVYHWRYNRLEKTS